MSSVSKKVQGGTESTNFTASQGCRKVNGTTKSLSQPSKPKLTLKKLSPSLIADLTETLIAVEIPGLPPSVNAIWRSTYGKGGRTYKPKSVKDWQDSAAQIMSWDLNRRGKETYEGVVVEEIMLDTTTLRRMDVDNRIKAVQDCLEPAGVLKDDSQVWSLKIIRRIGLENSVFIRIRTATAEDLKGDMSWIRDIQPLT